MPGWRRAVRRAVWGGVIALAAIGLLRPHLAPPSPAPTSDSWSATCIKVADGDTITVLHDGAEEKLRLAGIDCPEKAQPFGQRAKQFTADQVFRRTVTVQPQTTDRYGRTVAEVLTPRGESLNLALVQAGLAWWYEQYAPDDQRLARAQDEARAAGRGLWADASPTAPWDWRQERRTEARLRRERRR